MGSSSIYKVKIFSICKWKRKTNSFKICFDKEYVIVIKFSLDENASREAESQSKLKRHWEHELHGSLDFQVDYSYHGNLHIYGILLFLPCNISIVNNDNNVGTYTHFWLIIDWIIQHYLNCVMQVLIIPINFVFGMNYEVCSYSYNYWRKKDNSEY